MLLDFPFEGKVVATFQKFFKDNNGKDVPYYNLSFMTDRGVATVKCNKDVYETLQNGSVKPMQQCMFFATLDVTSSKSVEKEFRVVGMSANK